MKTIKFWLDYNGQRIKVGALCKGFGNHYFTFQKLVWIEIWEETENAEDIEEYFNNLYLSDYDFHEKVNDLILKHKED
jgi:hypothetical protein